MSSWIVENSKSVCDNAGVSKLHSEMYRHVIPKTELESSDECVMPGRFTEMMVMSRQVQSQ